MTAQRKRAVYDKRTSDVPQARRPPELSNIKGRATRQGQVIGIELSRPEDWNLDASIADQQVCSARNRLPRNCDVACGERDDRKVERVEKEPVLQIAIP